MLSGEVDVFENLMEQIFAIIPRSIKKRAVFFLRDMVDPGNISKSLHLGEMGVTSPESRNPLIMVILGFGDKFLGPRHVFKHEVGSADERKVAVIPTGLFL